MLTTVVFGVVAGVLISIVLPALLKPTGFASSWGNRYFGFVAKALKRPAIAVGDHGSPSLAQLSFDSVYEQETVDVGSGVEKKITRTAGAVHRVGATPFTFFDERFGVTFDLRDVLVGAREHEHREDGEMIYTDMAFNAEGEPTRADNYWRGFFEFDERVGLDLDMENSIRPITDGSEEADWWDYVWEATRRMYILRQEEISVLKMLIPFIVGGAALFLGYYIFGPGPMPGAAGGGSAPDPISVGALLPAALGGGLDRVRKALGRVSWLAIAKTLGTLAGVGLLVLASYVAGPLTAALFWAGFVVGASLLPLLTLLLGALGYGTGMADLFLWAGLMAFDDPVINLTADDRYAIREAEMLGLEDYPRTKIAKTWVGLTCDVSPEAFGRAGYSSADVADYQPPGEVLADGGTDVLPRGYAVAEGMQKANKDAFVPGDLDERTTYVRVDTYLRRFKDAATGDGVDTAEREATKEFAAGDPKWSDGELMKYSAYAAVAGMGFWGVVALVL